MASFFFYSKISLYGILFFHKSIKLLLTCNVTGQKRLKWKSTIITFSLTWVSCVFFRWFFRRAKTIAMNFAKSGTIIEFGLNPLLPEWLINQPTDCLAYRPTDSLASWVDGWSQTDVQRDWSTDWLTDWLSADCCSQFDYQSSYIF